MPRPSQLALLGLAALSLAPAARAADNSPQGMVAFFMSATGGCPLGWQAPDLARGRTFVGTDSTANVGVTVNEALHDRLAPVHRHDVTLRFFMTAKDISAADGTNHRGAASGLKVVDAEAKASESGWGFTQLVACEKQ